jgi:hypothetical protein
MTTKLPRHIAEACLEQIKIQFKAEIEAGYGDPVLVEDWTDPDADGDQHWAICWDGPFEWTYRAQQGGRDWDLTLELRDATGNPNAVVETKPSPNWPDGVLGEPYSAGGPFCLYPA